jgi:hypothetical protein
MKKVPERYVVRKKDSRYMVRTMTTEMRDEGHVWLRQSGWWLYDWKEKKTVQTFPMSEQEQANGLCKLLNSIEEENDGL